MKKQKQPLSENNSSTEVRPEFFNFLTNKGKSISLILKNENVKVGRLLGICHNNTILLEMDCPFGVGSSETPLFDISEIIILDETSSLKFTSKN